MEKLTLSKVPWFNPVRVRSLSAELPFNLSKPAPPSRVIDASLPAESEIEATSTLSPRFIESINTFA